MRRPIAILASLLLTGVACAGCSSTPAGAGEWTVLEDGTRIESHRSARKIRVPEGATVHATADAVLAATALAIDGRVVGRSGTAGEAGRRGGDGASVSIRAGVDGVVVRGEILGGSGGAGGDGEEASGDGGDGGRVAIHSSGPVRLEPGAVVRGGPGGTGGSGESDGRGRTPLRAEANGGRGGSGGAVVVRSASEIECEARLEGGMGGRGGPARATAGGGREAVAVSGPGGPGGDVTIGGRESEGEGPPTIRLVGQATVRAGAGGSSGTASAHGGDLPVGRVVADRTIGGDARAEAAAGGDGGSLLVQGARDRVELGTGTRLEAGEGGPAGLGLPRDIDTSTTDGVSEVEWSAEAIGGVGRPGGGASASAGPGGEGGRSVLGGGQPEGRAPGGAVGSVRARGGAPEADLRPDPGVTEGRPGSDSGEGADRVQAASNGR